MKKYTLFSFFLLLINQISVAQSFTYFNQRIEIDDSNTGITATIPFTKGYYNVGLISHTHTNIYFSKIDIEGNLLEYHIIDDSPNVVGTFLGREFIETIDGNLAVVYQKKVESGVEDIILTKFTKEGNILWQQNYGGEGIDGQTSIIQTKDGGFLITGFLRVGVINEMYAVKTDSRGALEWENHYCLNRGCIAFSADETIDGGYILGGTVRTVNLDYDMYVVKIDSLGNQEWEKTYGGVASDPAGQVYVLEDGNFLLKGGIRQGSNRHVYLAKLDPIGEIIWEKSYSLLSLRTIQTPLVFREDGGFIGVAYYRNNNDRTHPLIMNFDVNGDTLWTKSITADPTADVYVRDTDKIEGGYVLTGFKFSPLPQYGWLVTIDEEGNFCEKLGCVETVVDIEDVAIEEEEIFIRISPNPVRGQATIQYQIPKDGVLKIYDYQGRLINKEELTMNNSHLILEVEDWASGVYLYQLEIGGERVESGKLVVEN